MGKAWVILFLGLCPTAFGQVIDREGKSWGEPYKSWQKAGYMPISPLPVTLAEEWCAEYGEMRVGACYIDGLNEIRLGPSYITRKYFWHELGHAFDYLITPGWARQWFLRNHGESTSWWETRKEDGSYLPPGERFAAAYQLCAMHPNYRYNPWNWQDYQYHPPTRLHRRTCKLFRQIYREWCGRYRPGCPPAPKFPPRRRGR